MVKNVLKGMLIGVANVIPGVSGGTVALLLGIYEKLTEAIGNYFQCTHKKRIEYTKFLVTIVIGAVLGIGIFSKVILFLFTKAPEEANFFFIGLIIASLPEIIKHRKKKKYETKEAVLFLLGGVLPLLLFLHQMHYGNVNQGLMASEMNVPYMIKLIFCGIMAGGAMIIPGISGSLLLMLSGEYINIINFVNEMQVFPIGLIGIGAIIGVTCFAKIFSKLLQVYHDETLYFLLGIIVFSLLELWPGITMSPAMIAKDTVVFLLGIGIVKRIK